MAFQTGEAASLELSGLTFALGVSVLSPTPGRHRRRGKRSFAGNSLAHFPTSWNSPSCIRTLFPFPAFGTSPWHCNFLTPKAFPWNLGAGLENLTLLSVYSKLSWACKKMQPGLGQYQGEGKLFSGPAALGSGRVLSPLDPYLPAKSSGSKVFLLVAQWALGKKIGSHWVMSLNEGGQARAWWPGGREAGAWGPTLKLPPRVLLPGRHHGEA